MTAPDNFIEIANEFFNGKCEVTLNKVKRTGFTIHHVKYIKNDIERKMFPYTPTGTEKYYDALYPLIQETPKRFSLITNGIHDKLDSHRHGVCRLNLPNRIRFCDLALRTVPKTRWGKLKK